MKKHRLAKKIALILGLSLLATSTALASPTLKNGSRGHDVLLLQQKLVEIGYAPGSADGVYGAGTERAVAAFQRDQNIRVTGVVNAATWRALKGVKSKKDFADLQPVAPAKAADTLPTIKAPLAPNNVPILPRSKVHSIISTAKNYIESVRLLRLPAVRFREERHLHPAPRRRPVQARHAHEEHEPIRTRRSRLLHDV